MFFFKRRKAEKAAYQPFLTAEENEKEKTAADPDGAADADTGNMATDAAGTDTASEALLSEDMPEWEEILVPEEDGETVTLDDGRVFSAAFVREIRALSPFDLHTVLNEQRELYTPEEYAYIRETLAERLGDIT